MLITWSWLGKAHWAFSAIQRFSVRGWPWTNVQVNLDFSSWAGIESRIHKSGSKPKKKKMKLETTSMKVVGFSGRKIMCLIYCPVHHDYHLLNTSCHSGVASGDLGIHMESVIFTPTLVYHLPSRWGNQAPVKNLEVLNNLADLRDLGSVEGRVWLVCLLTGLFCLHLWFTASIVHLIQLIKRCSVGEEETICGWVGKGNESNGFTVCRSHLSALQEDVSSMAPTSQLTNVCSRNGVSLWEQLQWGFG